MKRSMLFGLATAALVAFGAGASYVVRLHAAPAKPEAAAVDAQRSPGPIEFVDSDLVTVTPMRLARSIPLTGTLRPTQQTVVRSKVGGEIRELAVREGDPVRRGQTIARIDPVEYEWRVREREAQLKAAQLQVEQAQRTFDNNRRLLERGFISQNAFDNARSSHDVAIANRDAAAAQLTLARKALGDATLTAPMDGIVAERFAQAGEKVAVDGRILSIVDLSRMEIEAPVPAAVIGSVGIGQKVELAVEGIGRRQLGEIVRISPVTQAGTRSVPVYIALENRDPSVRAGMFAQGSIAVDARDAVLAIPQAAVRDEAGRSFVYLIDGERLTQREVRLGVRDETVAAPGGGAGVVEVVAGLAAGDRIVAVNLGALRTGAAVRVASRVR
ncbi:MAG TPA: efflux RND transporter periplasmic adaptor subunit [Burkholderiaceae bacterium]|nr:efflux RND transporter periplasmic adaptor subunit [Burkholderiaceae bacterium]